MRGPTCWFFWERAGLRSEDVMCAVPRLQRTADSIPLQNLEIVTAGSGPKRAEANVKLVAIPLLKLVCGLPRRKGR